MSMDLVPPHKWCDEDRLRLERELGFPPTWPIDDIDDIEHYTLIATKREHGSRGSEDGGLCVLVTPVHRTLSHELREWR
jgi:hypothetical protein